jgi:N4-gp56 family major capsid protein
MTQTRSTDLIKPDVWADMMQAEFVGRTVLGQDGGAFAVVDSTLEGQPGERVSTAKWSKLGGDDTLDDLDEGAPIVPDKLDQVPGEGPVIKEAGKGAEVTDRALLVGVGDPLAEVRSQFGTMTVRKVDNDLRAAAEAAGALTYDHTTATGDLDNGGKFGAGALAGALAKFGDDLDLATFAGFVIHSRQYAEVFRDPHFIDAAKLGDQSILVRGAIGSIYGVPIVVSDRTTVTGAVGSERYKGLLIKRGALVLYYKRRPVVETDRDILARSTVITTNVHYAAGRLKDNGVVVVTTK